jgi:hypothetical protein
MQWLGLPQKGDKISLIRVEKGAGVKEWKLVFVLKKDGISVS